MPVNPFAVGIDRFTQSVARRRADAYEVEDRARRAKLDEETRADRQAALDIRNRELSAMDAYRTDQNRIRDEENNRRQSETSAAQKAREELGTYLDEYDKAVAAGDENGKRHWGLRIVNSGGHIPAEPTPAKPGRHVVGGDLVDDEGKVLYHGREKAPTEYDKEDKDLPRGLRAEIDWYSQNGKTIEQAQQDLNATFNERRSRYPNASLGAAIDYLAKTYTKGPLGEMKPLNPKDTYRPGGEPPVAGPGPAAPPPPPTLSVADLQHAPPSAGGPMSFGSIDQGEQNAAASDAARFNAMMPGNAPPPPGVVRLPPRPTPIPGQPGVLSLPPRPTPSPGMAAPPSAPPAGAPTPGPSDQAAIQWLQANGAPITPANIAAVKARMAGGGL